MQLVKAFTKEEHAQNFQSGNIILKDILYYKELAKGKFRDPLDGQFFNNNGGRTLINRAFILCMHDCSYFKKHKNSEYGEFKLYIHSVDNLVNQIKNELEKAAITCSKSPSLSAVTYYGRDDLKPKDPFDLPFYKPERSNDNLETYCYKDDMEWRIAIILAYDDQFEKTSYNLKWKFFLAKDERYKPLIKPSEVDLETYKRMYKQDLNCNKNSVYSALHLSNVKFDSVIE